MLNLPISFGRVSIGKETASLPCKVDRSALPLNAAAETFIGMRLECAVTNSGTDAADQTRLPGMEDAAVDTLTGSADVKRLGIGIEEYSFGLIYSRGSIDVETLCRFANKQGRLEVTGVERLPDDDDSDSDSDDGDDGLTVDDHEDVGPRATRAERNGRPKTKPLPLKDDPAATVKLFAAFKDHGLTKKKCEAIAAAVGGETVGHLEKAMRENEWWHRDISGFGETWITKLQDAHLAFRRANPMPSDDPNTAEPDPAEQEKYHAAYTAGCEAALAGKGDDTNPHAADSPEGAAWITGHAATMAESSELATAGEGAP